MGWWGIAWTLSRCALNASAGIAKRKLFAGRGDILASSCFFVRMLFVFVVLIFGQTLQCRRADKQVADSICNRMHKHRSVVSCRFDT